MIDHSRIAHLLLKKLENKLSLAEEEEVEAWLNEWSERAFFEKEMITEILYDSLKGRMKMNEKGMDKRFYALLNRRAPVRQMFFMRRWITAASVLIAVISSAVLFYMKPASSKASFENPVAAVIRPGTNKAHLQLANGTTIELDTVKNGPIALQGASSVIKNGSMISYTASDGTAPADAYNILATPRAGQYQMVLPDGTGVWLNNASSLKYPVSFSGNQRRVELTGEAYFEVAKLAAKPFIVSIRNADIEVLGTSFNVSCYEDEKFQKTTLVEGKIRVVAGKDNLELNAGEQAEGVDGELTVRHPDVYSITAWRKGFFNFSDADIQTVMRQIARWYDVEIKYEGEPSKEKLEGSISRNQNLAETLAALDALHIHATVKNRTITVYS